MSINAGDSVFLGPGAVALVESLRKQHILAFELADEVNTFAHLKLASVSVKRSELQQVLIAALIPRLLTAFQACILTSERGMEAEATLLARKAIELTFRIVAVAKSKELAESYVKADQISRRNVLKKLKSLSTTLLSSEMQESIELLHAEVTGSISQRGLRDVSTKDFAEAAGLLDYYNTAYAYFSQSAHASVRDLESLFDKDANGEIEAIRYGPDGDFQTSVLSTAIEAMVMSLEAAFELIEKTVPEDIRVIRHKMERLFEIIK